MIPDEVLELCRFGGDEWVVVRSTEHSCVLRRESIEVRFQRDVDGTWTFDEVVGDDVHVHIEQMDDSWYWLGISGDDDHLLHVAISSVSRRAKVKMTGWSE